MAPHKKGKKFAKQKKAASSFDSGTGTGAPGSPGVAVDDAESSSNLVDSGGPVQVVNSSSNTVIAIGDDHQQFTTCGIFEEDFVRLCHISGIEWAPPVLIRSHAASPMDKGKSLTALTACERRKKISSSPMKNSVKNPVTRKVSGPASKMELAFGNVPSLPERLLSTDHDAAALSFVKPCIQVEYQQIDNIKVVKEIYIHGWKVDDAIMEVLNYCCVHLAERLALLQLWRAGLTTDSVVKLASFLPRCCFLTTLVLDNNPIGGDGSLSELIDQYSPVQHLSLRFCDITDQDALGIGLSLGSYNQWNRKLLTLNLSNNRITDVGARCLAGGLMTNRVLLVLNLASNQIGDEGAAALAEVLSFFVPNEEQMKYRRWIFAEREQPLVTYESECSMGSSQSEAKSKRRVPVPETPKQKRKEPTPNVEAGRRREGPTSQKTTKAKASKEKEHAEKRQRKGSRRSIDHIKEPDPSGMSARDSQSKRLDKMTDKEKEKTTEFKEKKKIRRLAQQSRKFTTEMTPLEWHPLAETGSLEEDGQFRIVGNRSLISLNLSRNRIQEGGLRKLLDMLEAQASPRGELDRILQPSPQLMQPPAYCSFTGLKRLVVHKNAVAADNNVLVKIQAIMTIRDPMYRRPLLTLHRENVSPCAMPPIAI